MKRLGVVQWFDKSSGEGMIFDAGTGISLYIHYSSIVQKNNNPKKNLDKNDLVIFSIYKNLYMSQIDKCRILEPDFEGVKYEKCLDMLANRGIDVLSKKLVLK